MLRRNQQGFTLSELIVVMMASSIMIFVLFRFTVVTVNNFMTLQKEGLAHSKLAEGSFRVSRVLRGANYIESASDDELVAYAYFAPQDEFTSKVRYYLNGDNSRLLADVTAMDADYPTGSLIPSTQKTVVIIDGFQKRDGFSTFSYFTSDFAQIGTPIDSGDLVAIKNIKVNLYARLYQIDNGKYFSSSVSVNLRNRKSNL